MTRCPVLIVALALCFGLQLRASHALAQASDAAVLGDAGVPESDLPPIDPAHAPQLRIEVPNAAPLGDVIRYVLTVDVHPGDDVTVPRQAFGELEVYAQRHEVRTLPNGHRVFTFTFELLGFVAGEAHIPSLNLRVVTQDGTVGAAKTEPRVVRVESRVGNEPNAQPRPASAPVVVMEDDYTIAYIAAGLAVLLLGALIGYFIKRWWDRRPKAMPPPPPPRPPWETAFVRLRELRLRQAELLADEKHDVFVDGVNDTLREYFGVRYGFNGLESTTDEILRHLNTVYLQSISIHEVNALLSQCDLIKFAKAKPTLEMCDEILAVSEKIVRGTIPPAVQMGPGAQTVPTPGPGGRP